MDALVPLVSLVQRVLAPQLVLVKSRRLFESATLHRSSLGDGATGLALPESERWWAELALARCVADHAAGAAAGSPLRMRSAKRYPLSYPRRYAAAGQAATDREEEAEETQRLCEFHNYDAAGCKRRERGECVFNHRNCHFCGGEGHRALECAEQLRLDALVVSAMQIDPAAGRQ
jgi:hypothetical protein